MNFKYGLKNSLKNLSVNKSRSILTILGIVIGITSIILVMSIGRGAQDLILNQIQGMGSKAIILAPGKPPSSFTDSAAMLDSIMGDALKEKEMEALSKKNNVPNVVNVIPIVFGNVTASYQSNTYRMMILGSTEDITSIYEVYPDIGNFFTEEDVASRANVVVIGSKVKTELFGEDDAVGKTIKIKTKAFRVIGVLASKGQGSLVNFDESAMAPYTTVQENLLGIKYFQHLIAEVDNEENTDQAVNDIKITLRNLHNITDPEKDDFNVQTQADMVKQVSTVTGVLTLFLASVAAISLLVGGVGIMNIMLVSVTERTREIGLRKAVGATGKDILTQFLLEAMMLTSIGGFIGIFLGVVLGFLTSVILTQVAKLNWGFSFPFGPALLGLGVAALIGLIFGIYPARQASKKSPIEALRYE
jgi:putative ABC transport system permease protein